MQPHWQFRSLQLQAPFSHPHEQLVQSVMFFELVILFSPFDLARSALSQGLTHVARKHYSPVIG
jgi:hypothetical protein